MTFIDSINMIFPHLVIPNLVFPFYLDTSIDYSKNDPQKFKRELILVLLNILLVFAEIISANSLSEKHVLDLDSNSFCVNRTQVGILEQPDQVRLGRGLERLQRFRGPPVLRDSVYTLSHISDNSGEMNAGNQGVSGLLQFSNFH